ncbi:LysR family transcriptional regulator [Rhizobium sp. Root1220]|uniref:LysR family transcriptional regulator n=1 Tax=Rhizobium sp. Root1220 TaxID=1736432 RepID=UPI0007013D0A|nr:LysR family transcriptional regulator [Rhizobium sp. Root1220]KQV65168.1 transcriptional regulator [Rhizobium sp. Root1220]
MGLDGFKLRHLRMLVALSEHGKLGVVAEMFGISQPALSRTLNELEQMSGHQLFERHNRGLAVTTQGEVIVRHARMLLAEAQRAEYEMVVAAAGQGGSVAFGTIITPAADYVTPALKRLFETHPTIDVSITVGSSDVLLEDVLSRRLDFAVCRIPSGMNPLLFDNTLLGKETLRVVVAENHPLADKADVTEADLRQQGWVLQPHGSFLRHVADDFIRRHGIVPESVVSTSDALLTMLLMGQSQRIGILAEPVARMMEQHRLLRILSIDADISVPDFGLLKLKDRELSASAELLYKLFQSL